LSIVKACRIFGIGNIGFDCRFPDSRSDSHATAGVACPAYLIWMMILKPEKFGGEAASYFGDNYSLRFTNRFACSASQTIIGPCRDGFMGHVKDIHGTELYTLLAAVTPIRLHVYQIDFEVPEYLCHN
jgi:hypothetical protein